jgi:ubiquinone biosynthesis protein
MEKLRRLILDLRRLSQLFRIALRFGLPLLVAVVLHPRARQRSFGVALRGALEQLGLTYLKLGQYLATRHDLVPPDVCAELEKVFESVPPLPWTEIRRVLEQELGPNLKEAFPVLETIPVAAASIAQVHKAMTKDGAWVAVKVQRPGIGSQFASDIRNLRRLALFVDRLGISGSLSVTEAVEQVAAYTRREMDFLIEGKTADRLRRNLTRHAVVPRIHWGLSTAKVLTMDFVEGPSLLQVIQHLETGRSAGMFETLPAFNLEEVLQNLAYESLHQLFVTGFFHGDPHPGNIIVLPDNRVAFLDFGIFGELNYYQRELLANYTAALAAGDVSECYRQIAKIYFPTTSSNEAAFELDARQTLGHWHRVSSDPRSSAADRHIGGAFDGMVRVVYRHRYRAMMGYLLFWRAIIVLDSVAIRLQPSFDLSRQARLFFEREQPDVLHRYHGWRSMVPQEGTLFKVGRAVIDLAHVVDSPRRIETAQKTTGYPGGIMAAFLGALLVLSASRLSSSTPVFAVVASVGLLVLLAAGARPK